jgi:hypothetical protein
LEEGVRGGRLFDLRFSMFVLDDIDSRKDSPAAVEKKLKIIAHEMLPAGTPDTLKLFPQNLIHEDSVLNQIYTRRSDVLSERQESGPVKAFAELELVPGGLEVERARSTDRGLTFTAHTLAEHLDWTDKGANKISGKQPSRRGGVAAQRVGERGHNCRPSNFAWFMPHNQFARKTSDACYPFTGGCGASCGRSMVGW